MKTSLRLLSLLVGLIIVSGCSTGQPDTKQPNPTSTQPAAAPKVQGQDNGQTGKVPAPAQPSASQQPAVETQPKTSATAKADSTATATAKSTPQKQAATSPPPQKPIAPKKLPELTAKDKQVVSKVTKEVEAESSITTQNVGITTVNRILVAQQAMWLLSGSFSTDFQALEPNLPLETDEYKFSIPQGDQAQTVVKAIAKTDKLHSFTGVAVAVPTNISRKRTLSYKTTVPNPTAAPYHQKWSSDLCQ